MELPDGRGHHLRPSTIGHIPKTQDAYYDFFQSAQDKLRSKGRRIYGLGYSMATKEADSGNLFHAFLVNYGGAGIVLPDGRLNIDDPAVRKAAITALAYAAVLSEQVRIQAEANITQKGMTPQQACDGAVERIKTIFERFRIA